MMSPGWLVVWGLILFILVAALVMVVTLILAPPRF